MTVVTLATDKQGKREMRPLTERAIRALNDLAKTTAQQDVSPETTAARMPEGCATAPCGSPDCAGCYLVAPGIHIHPPRVSAEWLDWLEKWTPKSERPQ